MPRGKDTRSAATIRFEGIDGLRAFAVSVVIAAHSLVPFMPGGLVGVDVFFGISGFLITFLLLQERERFGSVSLKGFWLRRALRILPALLTVVVVIDMLAIAYNVVGVGALHLKPQEEITQVLPSTPSVLLYYANWMLVTSHTTWLGWFGPMWSLSVEEQFYVLWPLVLVLVLRYRDRLGTLAGICLTVCVVANVWRITTFDGSDLFQTFNTLFRVDMLLLGVLLAIALQAGHARVIARITRWSVWPAIAWLTLVVVFMPQWGAPGAEAAVRLYYFVGLPVVGLSTFSIIGFLVTHQSSRLTALLQWRPIAYIGRISYGMYLWHYAIVHALFHTRMLALGVFAVGMLVTVGVATLSSRLIERPLYLRFHEALRPAVLHRTPVILPAEPAMREPPAPNERSVPLTVESTD